jgi:polyhydroxyalkanoate synthase
MDLWTQQVRRMQGETVDPVARPDPKDSRFADPDWTANPYFDFLKQGYLLTARWAEDMVERAEGLDEAERQRARFYVKQIASALSPSNFLATNPEVLRETMKENGANLVRGMRMLAEDIEAGPGRAQAAPVRPEPVPGRRQHGGHPRQGGVRNDLIELIQYAPATETVLKRPLLIVPPWINKFYVLDLNPEKSFIRWAVSQGITVFCISWVNPDERHAHKGFEEYMREGIFAALDAVEQATGEKKVTTIGYCVGGTLLAVALAYMAAKGDDRIESATLFTTQVDFTHAGDLKVFAAIRRSGPSRASMKAKGYLDGAKMATAFNMLRPNDLIWPYVVNVYLKGHEPFPFDLLYWNSDSTRMPRRTTRSTCATATSRTASRGRDGAGGPAARSRKVKIPIS